MVHNGGRWWFSSMVVHIDGGRSWFKTMVVGGGSDTWWLVMGQKVVFRLMMVGHSSKSGGRRWFRLMVVNHGLERWWLVVNG